jgi:pyruvate kinase
MNATKIVCTLGPSTFKEDQIYRLAEIGMSVARINLSHATWEQHVQTVRAIKRVNERLAKNKKGRPAVAILLDSKGPEIRTGVVDVPLKIAAGEKVVFTSKPLPKETLQTVMVNYNAFSKDVKHTDVIVVDNGKLNFSLVDIRKDGSVVAKAQEDGVISSRRHVNLPGVYVSLPSITDKDWEDVQHGMDEDVDFFALSFIREAKDITDVRKFIEKKGKHIGLIAKIETAQSVEDMENIIEASDGIMVARGDLGSEVDFVRIPAIQDELVARTRDAGKPVIVATHMLESMIENPTPTRAEVTDIAYAVTTGTDATMLSGETANGKFPFKALEAMVRVTEATEKHVSERRRMDVATIRDDGDARALSAVSLAVSTGVDAMVVMSKSGATAQDISRFRPDLPIIACTPDTAVQRMLTLCYGVVPLHVPFADKDPEKTVINAFDLAKARGLLKKNQKVVLVTDSQAHNLRVASIQTRLVP